MKKIKLIETRSELGAGTRGAGMGVDAIRVAALDFGSSFFRRYESVEVPHENHRLMDPCIHDFARRIDAVYGFCERLSAQVMRTVSEKGNFPVILAGDHTSAIGSVSGIRMAFPDKKLGVVWIDAHADIHTPYTTPSGNMHGMSLAALLGEDNAECRINKPSEETIAYWEKIKNLGGLCPKIAYEDIFFISLRDLEKQEDHLLKKHSIRNISVPEVRSRGVEWVADHVLAAFEEHDLIYISFDADSIDPGISKGTGTPVPDGLSEKEAGNLILQLLRSRKACCLEVVEVNPTLDRENLMAENVFEILLKATNQLVNDF